MYSPNVKYNAKEQTLQCELENGNLSTFFLVPKNPKEGDQLPRLILLAKKVKKPFQFSGEYHSGSNSLKFLFEGPAGYSYKLSISLDPGEEHYISKVKKHGKTGSEEATKDEFCYVPMSICRENAPIVHAMRDLTLKNSFHGPSLSTLFLALRLKITVVKGEWEPGSLAEKEEEDKKQHATK